MNKVAYKSDYIYYDGKLQKNKYLIINNKIVESLSDTSEGCEIIEFSNSCIFPGFINTHTHLPMVYFRGLADDLPLMEWLQKHIWPAESKWLSDEFCFHSAQLAAIEMIKSGTVCACDMYFHSESIGTALINAGVKGILGGGVLDFPTKIANNADEYIEKAAELLLKFKENDDINIALAPHAPYTVGPESFKKCIDFSNKHDVLIHTHLSESTWEIAEITKKYGKSPALLMDETGMFDAKTIFAHCVHLSDEEIKIMGEKNVNVSHCITSNLKLANGFAPIKKLMDAGANISIGTDGAASNNNLDMVSEISMSAKVNKALSEDPTFMDAETALKCATENGAKALYLDKMGSLKSGNYADFFVLSFDSAHMTPVYNPVSHLIYSASSSDISHTYVNGKCLMENGKILTLNEDEVKKNARKWADKIKNN